MAGSADIFDAEAQQYDAWFDTPEGRLLFENELQAIRLLWDQFRPALEVGVGTGRFAQSLGVEFSIDPAAGAVRLAEPQAAVGLFPVTPKDVSRLRSVRRTPKIPSPCKGSKISSSACCKFLARSL